MKKSVFIIILCASLNCFSADLMEVFQQALRNDNLYQESVLRVLSYKADIAINRAYLLPNAQLNAQPLVDQQANEGAIVPLIQPANNTYRSYDMRLSLSQPIFNFAIFSRYQASKIVARAALAQLNADLQDLMFRVAEAYFNVLRSEKKLSYLRAHKKALAKQLYDVRQRYKAGKSTKTYVYMAQTSYSAAESDHISAETELAAAQERLSELTAADYPFLAGLKKAIPLISPKPCDMNRWVKKALSGNWVIKANQLRVQSAREKIKQTYADHLPTIHAKVLYDDNSFHNTEGSLIIAPGSSRARNAAALLNVKVPLFSGGLVVATTRKAQYEFRMVQQKLNHSLRQVTLQVRNSYRNVVASIKKIQYQQDAIRSAQSSLEGLKARYAAGGGNLTDVLNEQAQLLEAQMQYELARYDYIMNLLKLKKEAGTLSTHDLIAVNRWLQTWEK